MRYSTLGGGKRLRALLTMAACVAEGGNREDTAALGAAVEMAHAHSLSQDDLPWIADSLQRRGTPTNHIVYGEANAVLAGDALLTEACAVLAKMPETMGISAESTALVIS